MLKKIRKIRKEALKHLSLAFRKFNQPLSWLPLGYTSGSFHSVRNLPKQGPRIQEGMRIMPTEGCSGPSEERPPWPSYLASSQPSQTALLWP